MYYLSSITKALSLAVLSTQSARASPAPCSPSSLNIKTSSGIVYGAINGTVPGVLQFLGIPFAYPPVGELRWLPPVPLNSRDSSRVIDATEFSPSCPQFESGIPNLYSKIVREFFINGPTSEDCLTLSIWAPAAPVHKPQLLPVYIFIYGGGFSTGGSSVPYQNPAQWVQRTQAHIVVSIQYRLNIFGFPQAPGLTFQNLGILDQRLAIEWIQSNIKSFGGDPNKMILWGQSAGAASVDIQNYAFPSNPIVRGFVCDSGSALLTIGSSGLSYSSFNIVAKHFNCSVANAEEGLGCMRKISSSDIEAFLKTYGDSGSSPALSFSPTADNLTVFSNYTQRLLDRQISTAPAIFGTNNNEGVSFVPFPANPGTTGPNTTLAAQATLMFFCPTVETSRLRDQVGLPTYRYQYRGNFTNVSPEFWMGAYHSSELPLIFGTSGDFRGANTEFEAAVSTAMQDAWLEFALNTYSPQWPKFSQGLIEVFGGTNNQGEDVPVQIVPADTVDVACSSS